MAKDIHLVWLFSSLIMQEFCLLSFTEFSWSHLGMHSRIQQTITEKNVRHSTWVHFLNQNFCIINQSFICKSQILKKAIYNKIRSKCLKLQQKHFQDGRKKLYITHNDCYLHMHEAPKLILTAHQFSVDYFCPSR